MNKDVDAISMQTLKRLPVYLNYLEKEKLKGTINISTPKIAKDLGLTEILVKKDIRYVTSKSGRPKIGHAVEDLIFDLKEYLGYNNCSRAVLVGAGQLGKALLGYHGFNDSNIEIVVAFDNDPRLIDTEVSGIKIVDIQKLENLCIRLNVHIGIITTNESSAQEVCDALVKGGVQAIWNFAPLRLQVPEGVIVQNENLASSLAILSKKLSDKISK